MGRGVAHPKAFFCSGMPGGLLLRRHYMLKLDYCPCNYLMHVMVQLALENGMRFPGRRALTSVPHHKLRYAFGFGFGFFFVFFCSVGVGNHGPEGHLLILPP